MLQMYCDSFYADGCPDLSIMLFAAWRVRVCQTHRSLPSPQHLSRLVQPPGTRALAVGVCARAAVHVLAFCQQLTLPLTQRLAAEEMIRNLRPFAITS